MSDVEQKPPVRFMGVGGIIGTFIGLVIGGAITYYGGGAVLEEIQLRRGANTVSAQVTNERVMESRRKGRSYEVTYRFRVKGKQYTHADNTGRKDLWATLKKPVWEKARRTRRVEVSYLPRNPWVNRPVGGGGSPMGDPIAGLVLGLLIGLPCLLLLGYAIVDRIRGPRPT